MQWAISVDSSYLYLEIFSYCRILCVIQVRLLIKFVKNIELVKRISNSKVWTLDMSFDTHRVSFFIKIILKKLKYGMRIIIRSKPKKIIFFNIFSLILMRKKLSLCVYCIHAWPIRTTTGRLSFWTHCDVVSTNFSDISVPAQMNPTFKCLSKYPSATFYIKYFSSFSLKSKFHHIFILHTIHGDSPFQMVLFTICRFE